MVRLQLDERQWQKVKAALGMRRTGAPWRDPVRQHQKLQRQVVDIQSFVIELHHAPSVTRLAGCLSHRSTAWAPTWKLIAPARAAARGARVPGTRHKPRPTSPHTADGNLRTVGHGHGHGHVYGETSNLGTRPSPRMPWPVELR